MSTDLEKLVISLEANMRGYERAMQRAIGQTNQTARRMETRFERANQSIGRGFSAMSAVGVRALGALGVAVGAAQLARLTGDTLQLAETMTDTADRVGFTVEQLQELRFAADQNGSSARTLDMALQRFSRRVGEAANGTGELRQSLIETGIQLRNSDGTMRTSYELLLDYADAIQAAESDQRALGLAFKAFDSEGASLVTLMRQGRDGAIEYGRAARDLGLVLEEDLARKGAEANRELRNLRQEVGAEFNRAVLENVEGLEGMAQALADIAKWGVQAAAAMGNFYQNLADGTTPDDMLQGQRLQVSMLEDRRADLLNRGAMARELRSDPDLPESQRRMYDDMYTDTIVELREVEAQLRSAQTALDDLEQRRAQLAARNEQTDMRGAAPPAAPGARTESAEMRKQRISRARIDLEADLAAAQASGDERRERALSRQIALLTRIESYRAAELPNFEARARADQERIDGLEDERLAQDRINEVVERRRDLEDEQLEHRLEIARIGGTREEVRLLEEELRVRTRIRELVERGASAVEARETATAEAMAVAVESERSRFARAFGGAFADGAGAALDGDLADHFARRLQSSLQNRLFDLFTKLGEILYDSLSGTNGGLGGFLASAAGAVFGGGKAAGGPVRAGYAYRVGERGPETIIPSQPGFVLPNNATQPMRGQGGGVTVVNQFHLHAEGAVMTDELLREMDAKAETAGRTAVAVSRNDLATMRKRQSRRL